VAGALNTSMLGTGLVFHHFSIMEGNGVGREVAATVFVTFGVVQAVSNLSTGWALDRVPPRFLLAGAQAAMAAALVYATHLTAGPALVAYGIVLGTMQGMSGAIGSTVFAHYFGRAHHAAIKGAVSTITVAGTAAGPLLFSLGHDLAGTYRPTLIVAAVAPLVIALAAPWLRLVTDDGIR
ncbi:MAG TPA: MFS transporter, partial [Acidimicrobiia bacterium]|nr:MFS transporter [Acidimicrobiia bacterium]